MRTQTLAWGRGVRGACLLLMLIAVVLGGCEVDSYFDPSVVGRWERTPATLPILDRLDIIDEPPTTTLEVTGVRPEDLIPDVREYVIGAGDLITVTIFELIRPGEEAIQTVRVNETGMIRLPVVGAVRASGYTPSRLEDRIGQILERQGVLRDAIVSVILQEARQNTYSVIGEPEQGGTAVGTYAIPKPDFRLLDALAQARGVPGRTKKLLIYRQTALTQEAAGEAPIVPEAETVHEAPPAPPADPAQLIEELMQGEERPATQEQPEAPAPSGLEAGLESSGPAPQWINVDGQWKRVDEQGAAARQAAQQQREAALSQLITQRIIEIPYDRLLEGDMRYNIVIRPGDVIRVPAPTAGFVYVMGFINRPGAYVVPGENDLTLKQLVASAGGLSQLAIPERVDLIRRVADNQEAIVRIDLRAIFEGREPDFFLKPNDMINVGTNLIATPLAVIRNGFRTTYGFGFVLDRNFNTDVFGNNN